ncbi:MAG: hypothetical protein AAGH15_25205 [Myxococcota bacterium]
MASPLLGYNTNVRHRGKLFHIQTEDSGVRHPHVITHLFADGGRIVASKKTSYAELIGAEDFQARVKEMMREQHKGMFIALRDGHYDEDGAEPTEQVKTPPLDVDALEAAAARLAREGAAASAAAGAGRYQSTRPARMSDAPLAVTTQPPESIFGGELLSEKSLDEVILGYLAEDLDDEG